jgi:serine/threonine protein kinase
VVHRDVKPGNVLLSRRGEVKLADFGLARRRRRPDHRHRLGVVGTPAYMSPEQVLGDRLDFRSDLFSFGIVLYELLTGRRPFEEDPARTVMQKIRLDRYVPRALVRATCPRCWSASSRAAWRRTPPTATPATGSSATTSTSLSRVGAG